MLSTNQMGAIAEAEIIAVAARLGIGVFRPVMDERCDLILDLRPRLIRVQCKTADRHGDVVVVRCYSTRRTANGLVRRFYTADEVDAVAAYCPELDVCYLLTMHWLAGRCVVHLRHEPTRNNQKLGVNWASEVDFAATLGRLQGP